MTAGWRQVVVDSVCKLSYSNDYLMVRGEKTVTIHLSEISTVIVANNMVVITAMLLNELSKWKIKVVFCDETHNPYGEIAMYYGHSSSSKRVAEQILWSESVKAEISTLIIGQKIVNQAKLLCKLGLLEQSEMLQGYFAELQLGDKTNREGHAAKVYFNAIFGKEFSRGNENFINAALNYGYSIILSCVNREVVAYGYLTQVGIKHCNEYNHFNLSCDIVEPFRIVVDDFVCQNAGRQFDSEYKHDLVNLLNKKVILDKEYCLCNAVGVVVQSVIKALNENAKGELLLFEFDKSK